MTQSSKLKGKQVKPGAKTAAKSGKVLKREKQQAKLKVGKGQLQLPKGRFREIAIEDRELSKAIAKANEQKVAGKLIQGGGKLTTKDILQKGKELNREKRRSEVKRKVGRVEEKLKELKERAEREGMNDAIV